MKKWFVRIGIMLLAVFVTAGLIYQFALRGWCLRWGTTPAEVRSNLPGDDLFPVYAGRQPTRSRFRHLHKKCGLG